MSRIGRKPVAVPKGVVVTAKDDLLTVKGPKGELTQTYSPANGNLIFDIQDDKVVVDRKNDSKPTKSFHGLYRNLLNNMIIGVSEGFKKTLEINGVGYRAEAKGNSVIFSLGYSTLIEYVIPEGVKVECVKNTVVDVTGIDKAKVGQAAAEIRSLRPPEPYKGKGIKYSDEHIQRKVGKTGVK